MNRYSNRCCEIRVAFLAAWILATAIAGPAIAQSVFPANPPLPPVQNVSPSSVDDSGLVVIWLNDVEQQQSKAEPIIPVEDPGDIRLVQFRGRTRAPTTARRGRSVASRGTPSRSENVSSSPNVIGDLFDGGSGMATIRFETNLYATGAMVTPVPPDYMDPNSVLAFEIDGTPPFNDFTTLGPGRDTTGDQFIDTYDIAEPVPPTNAPTSPGPTFEYDGGTAVFTGNTTDTTAQPGPIDDREIWYASYSFSQTVEIPPGVGVAVRRIKIAENNSPVPQDRMYFDYKFFRNVRGPYGDVSRFVYGFEKTFFSGKVSLDTRLPFAGTLDVDQYDFANGDGSGIRSVEFGNVTLISKAVLFESDTCLVAGGIGFTLPTGSDTRLFLFDGTQVIQVENNSFHVLPYFAGLWTPNDRVFMQGFLQVDVDTNGNPVRGDINGGVLPQIGVQQDVTLFFTDVSAGYWLTRDCTGERICRGLAGIAELHYNTSTQDADVITAPGISISSLSRRFDVLNATFGLHAELFESLSVTGGMTFPLRDGHDRQFDHEVAAMVNWYF